MAKKNYSKKLKQMAVDNARNLYPTMECVYFKSNVNQNFKHTFFNYFPAKEDDCFENVIGTIPGKSKQIADS